MLDLFSTDPPMMSWVTNIQQHTSFYTDPRNVPIELGIGAHKVSSCHTSSLDVWFELPGVILLLPRYFSITGFDSHQRQHSFASSRSCVLNLKSCWQFNPTDCCCHSGDSQPAQRPMLLSGVPQHEKWVGHRTHWSPEDGQLHDISLE